MHPQQLCLFTPVTTASYSGVPPPKEDLLLTVVNHAHLDLLCDHYVWQRSKVSLLLFTTYNTPDCLLAEHCCFVCELCLCEAGCRNIYKDFLLQLSSVTL